MNYTRSRSGMELDIHADASLVKDQPPFIGSPSCGIVLHSLPNSHDLLSA